MGSYKQPKLNKLTKLAKPINHQSSLVSLVSLELLYPPSKSPWMLAKRTKTVWY